MALHRPPRENRLPGDDIYELSTDPAERDLDWYQEAFDRPLATERWTLSVELANAADVDPTLPKASCTVTLGEYRRLTREPQ